jgi:ABC-type nitrate/sulfonate/bicarbonate transport system permease component
MTVQATLVHQDSAPAADDLDRAWAVARRRSVWRRRLMPLFGAATLIALWWALVAVFHVPPFIAPSPEVVAITIFQKFGMLMANLRPTAIEAVSGFLIGNAVAIAIASLFVHRKTLEEAFLPIVVLINSIPVVAKAPILVLLMGNGLAPKVAIAAIICFFPTLVNMVRGLEAVSPQAMELMHVLSASKREVFFKLRLPTSLPFLRPKDRHEHRHGRRHRRRMDRVTGRDRRPDHPGDLQFRCRTAVRDRTGGLVLLRRVFPDDPVDRAARDPLAARCITLISS